MEAIYAIEIKKSQLPLLTFLNDGKPPQIKKDTWLIFKVSEDGSSITTQIITRREMAEIYDPTGRQPFLVKLKRYFGDKK